MSNRKQPSSRGWIGSFVAIVISMAVALSLISYSGLVADTFNYYRYHPDPTIASFASGAGLNKQGTFLFYASQPSLESAQDFNKDCGRTEAKTAILGCYSARKIHIYDIQDTRLTGIRTVTAAHEMLHAAYERLGEAKKQDVNRMLEAEYNSLKNDTNLQSRMAFYDRTEPGERDNELHSVLGTEVQPLSPELETYYRQYFTDRSKVVALHDQYQSVFTGLQTQADDLNTRIKALDASIKSDTATYNTEADALKSDIDSFNARAKRGDFSSQAEFSATRQKLVVRADALEELRTKINSTIQEYNQLVTELNGIATQTDDLYRSIDSNLASPPTL